jgi:hypothetical protein
MSEIVNGIISYADNLRNIKSTDSAPVPSFWMTEKEVAEFLSIAQITLKLGRRDGVLLGVQAPTYLRVGRNIRYRFGDIIEWQAQFQAYQNTTEEKYKI